MNDSIILISKRDLFAIFSFSLQTASKTAFFIQQLTPSPSLPLSLSPNKRHLYTPLRGEFSESIADRRQ